MNNYTKDLIRLMNKQKEIDFSQLTEGIAGAITHADHCDKSIDEAIKQIKAEAIKQARCEISEEISISNLLGYPQAAFSDIGQGLLMALKILTTDKEKGIGR